MPETFSIARAFLGLTDRNYFGTLDPMTTTYTMTMEVQFEGHRRCGGSVMVEVEYELRESMVEYELRELIYTLVDVVSVKPFDWKRDHGVVTTTRIYLDCPPWLAEEFRRCIDISNLRGDE